MKKDDPCTGVCAWDGKTGWCLGCGRTVPEIKAWRKLTPYRRTALLRELPRRMEQLSKQQPVEAQAEKAQRSAHARELRMVATAPARAPRSVRY